MREVAFKFSKSYSMFLWLWLAATFDHMPALGEDKRHDRRKTISQVVLLPLAPVQLTVGGPGLLSASSSCSGKSRSGKFKCLRSLPSPHLPFPTLTQIPKYQMLSFLENPVEVSFELRWFLVRFLHNLLVQWWIFSKHSNVLPLFRNMLHGLKDDSKLSLMSECVWFSVFEWFCDGMEDSPGCTPTLHIRN